MTAAPSLVPVIEWEVAARTHGAETVCGDHHVVAPFPGGVLVAAIDGLGHGPDAADAATIATIVLREAADQPVTSLVERCHAALRRTRGAVLSLASFDVRQATMTWTGVGNVTGILYRADRTRSPPRETLLLRSGVVGYQLPALRAATLPVADGDVLILATDGIKDDFIADDPCGRPPGEVAHEILGRHAKSSDDALAIVARYLGAPP